MSHQDPRPPGLSRRLIAWAAHRLGTPSSSTCGGTVVEKARHSGERAAQRWYRRQVCASLTRLLLPSRLAPGLSTDAKLGVRMLLRYPG